MILIFGGADQGKLEFARKRWGNGQVYDCRRRSKVPAADGAAPEDREDDPLRRPDFTAGIIDGLEAFVWDCCTEDPAQRVEAAEVMRRARENWAGQADGGQSDEDPPRFGKIFIIDDVSQGIVPMEERTRAFREMNGRLMTYLASEADEVYRVFCGIGRRIK